MIKPSIFLAVLMWMLVATGLSTDAQQEPPPATVHVVQRGETLYHIAQQYDLTIAVIAQVNGIVHPGSIQVGQRLIIPTDFAVEEPTVPEVHVVSAGETLRTIADFYGVTVDDLVAANSIENPDAIYIGQELAISPGATANASGQAPAVVIEAAPIDVVHVVQRGETLFRIATQYGLSVEDVQRVNNIPDATQIYAGQELTIPGVRPPPLAAEFPAPITEINLTPTVLSAGRSGRVRIVTEQNAAVRGRFLGQEIQAGTTDGLAHVLVLGIPIMTAADVYSFQLEVALSDREAVSVVLNIRVLNASYGSETITIPEDRLALLSPAVEDNELAILRDVTSGFTTPHYIRGPLSLPAAALMNAPFGTLRSYNGGAFDRYHTGADFAGMPGSAVVAAAPGRITMADTLNIRGISVVIDHGWGIYTNYSHLSESYVQVGDVVSTGQTIGAVGSTGRVTGAHLHWELWVNGVPVDPMQWVLQPFF